MDAFSCPQPGLATAWRAVVAIARGEPATLVWRVRLAAARAQAGACKSGKGACRARRRHAHLRVR